MKFRKKPVVIEAWKFTGIAAIHDMPMWVAGSAQDRAGSDSLFILTLEGVMETKPGDWIIKGVSGKIYPIKNEIFLETYEAVDAA